MRSLVFSCLCICCLHGNPTEAQIPTGPQLPDTAPLSLDEPLDVVMVRGINRFAERELAASRERRAAMWKRDYSGGDAYQVSVEGNRQRLREIIGATGNGEPQTEGFHSRLFVLARGITDEHAWDLFSAVDSVRWEVFPGFHGEGFLVYPELWRGEKEIPHIRAAVVLAVDPGWDGRGLLGRSPAAPQIPDLVRRLGEYGCLVLVVPMIDRETDESVLTDIRRTNLPHREFVYRTSFELGRHVIGFEVQKLIAARRALERLLSLIEIFDEFDAATLPIAIAGVGEGGLLALYTAAVDPQFDAALVSGYFQEREGVWREPIYRNVWNLLSEFGDADLASLIAPRPLVIEAAAPPLVKGPPEPKQGQSQVAAPGEIAVPPLSSVQAEFERAKRHYVLLNVADRAELVAPSAGMGPPGSNEAIRALLRFLQLKERVASGSSRLADEVDLTEELRGLQQRQVGELVRHTQALLHRSDKERYEFWGKADRSSPEKWVETSQWYRDFVHDHMIGRLPPPTAPLNPRSRKVIDEPGYVGYEVVLDVYPREESEARSQKSEEGADAGVIAGGILLVPKDLKPGEKRPVVVCQHGLEGTPMDTITEDQSAPQGWGPYKAFSVQFVKRDDYVYAPQNPYKGEDEFRVIQRKSNPLGRSLFSYIIEQHRQTLKWLATLPYVDRDRIGFYGLSYGGKTAVRVPPLLPPTPEQPGYCLSICSADFNEWIRKNVSSEDRYSYVFTKEYEMFEWNMGHIAGYAELASLMAPRPFMVERGHDDGVAPDEWVGWEFAKVRRHYDKLGLGDRTEIEWFNGPHTINGEGTFRFLAEQLKWPEQ